MGIWGKGIPWQKVGNYITPFYDLQKLNDYKDWSTKFCYKCDEL